MIPIQTKNDPVFFPAQTADLITQGTSVFSLNASDLGIRLCSTWRVFSRAHHPGFEDLTPYVAVPSRPTPRPKRQCAVRGGSIELAGIAWPAEAIRFLAIQLLVVMLN